MSEERRRQIVERIEHAGEVRVGDLSSQFLVSEVTIRKDLAELEARGVLQRTHGGAALAFKSGFNLSFTERERLHAAAKLAIAVCAASYIHEGDAIALDAGSTTLALAKKIKTQFHKLTVLTNSMPIALELSKTNWDVILVGGQVRQHSLALVGNVATQALQHFHVDKAFIGATGVTLNGYSTPNTQDADLKRAWIAIATQSHVLTDSSKLGHAALVSYAKLNEVSLLITDSGADAAFCELLRERQTAFVLAA